MKVWVDNEEIDDGDFNYIGARLVHRYNSEGERAAGIPTPGNGQMAYVTDIGMTMWTGGTEGSWKLITAALLPAGGTTGQVLAKASNDDYDVEWVTP